MKTTFTPLHVTLCFVTISAFSFGQCWQQMGNPIDGSQQFESLGRSVRLNDNGQTIIIGAPQYNFSGGKTSVFNWTGSTWEQKGQDLVGEPFESTGESVDLSADGNIIAVSARYNGDTFLNAGAIRLFEWDGDSWEQKGSTIYGDTIGQGIGNKLDLSDDGTYLVTGAPFQNYGPNDTETIGLVRAYKWDTSLNDWIKIGSDQVGFENNDWFGYSVAISNDGQTMAASAKFSGYFGTYKGYVKVFHWDGNDWNLEETIIGGVNDAIGTEISLSANGQVLAIAAEGSSVDYENSGSVLIYDRNSQGVWSERSVISGGCDYSFLGMSCQLNADGTFVIIGGRNHPDEAQWSELGFVSVYHANGSDWDKVEEDLIGENYNEHFGSTVSISDDGAIIATGLPQSNISAEGSGQTIIYKSCLTETKEETTPTFTVSPNPSNGESLTIEMPEGFVGSIVDINDINGRTVYTTKLINNQIIEIGSNVSPGTYIISINTGNKLLTSKWVQL